MPEEELRGRPRTWLVTGAAGFIGSHLSQVLLSLGQTVRGLDNFMTGRRAVAAMLAEAPGFRFVEGDIRDETICAAACDGVDFVLHHAAAASVPLSVEQPAFVDSVNSGGFINILSAAAQAGVRHVVYASSSAVYGDADGEAARHEREALRPLSPYAVSKCANELYAAALSGTHGVSCTGLRYFNIYGPRQDPEGAYAAVIPRWISLMKAGRPVEIFGDGETVRDFCFVGDAARANIAAALTGEGGAGSRIYNIAGGRKVTLNALFDRLKGICDYQAAPAYRPFRPADIRVSCASIEAARRDLGFAPTVGLDEGLALSVAGEVPGS